MENISDADYGFLKKVSEDWMGSVFRDDKKYLFENRLLTMVKKFEYSSIRDLISDMQSKGGLFPKDRKAFFIDLITTHETLFFRDKTPFKSFKDVILPDFLKQGALSLNIMSAACSTGQEPVSLAIQLSEIIESMSLQMSFKIFGVDISEAVIQVAQNGLYSQYEVQRGMPAKFLPKYFEQVETSWRVKPELKNKLHYSVENLLAPMPKMIKYDLVLCRNVTIYMDPPKVRKIYEHLHSVMKKGSWLIIGHSERMTDHTDLFEYHKTDAGIVYRRI
jgi:chemotaxis protein methyltransferase CheR